MSLYCQVIALAVKWSSLNIYRSKYSPIETLPECGQGIKRRRKLTAQVSFRNPKVERAKAFARKYPWPVWKIGEDILQALINLRAERKIVDEDDGRRQDAFSEFGVKKIAFGQLKFGMGFAVESHPKFKISLHLLLKKGKYKTNIKKRNFRVRLFFTEICNRLLYQAAW